MERMHTFAATEQSTRNAFVRWSPYRDAQIADGFKEAADAVIAHAMEDVSHPDRFLFPVAFMYRHALEVKLKTLCRKAADLTTTALLPKGLNTHNLLSIWRLLRPMLEQVWPTGSRQELERVEQVIRDFQAADPGAQAFRYETDTAGNENLKKFPDSITLAHLQNAVNSAYELLDGCEMGLDHYLEMMTEALGESQGH